tara:strand:- start:209 stop:379 length:171 start_codon:yes stop_codon:yes gene_type:complete
MHGDYMTLLLINIAIYGLFGVAVVLITRHHNKKMQAIWDRWDAKHNEIMERNNDNL